MAQARRRPRTVAARRPCRCRRRPGESADELADGRRGRCRNGRSHPPAGPGGWRRVPRIAALVLAARFRGLRADGAEHRAAPDSGARAGALRPAAGQRGTEPRVGSGLRRPRGGRRPAQAGGLVGVVVLGGLELLGGVAVVLAALVRAARTRSTPRPWPDAGAPLADRPDRRPGGGLRSLRRRPPALPDPGPPAALPGRALLVLLAGLAVTSVHSGSSGQPLPGHALRHRRPRWSGPLSEVTGTQFAERHPGLRHGPPAGRPRARASSASSRCSRRCSC